MKRILLLVITTVLCIAVNAENKKKEIQKIFNSKDADKVFVQNKYGKIEVEQWNEDKVQFDIIIKADSRKSEAVDEMLSQIDVEFVRKATYISAETVFDDDFSVKNIANKLFAGGGVSVDYKIRIPKGMTLKAVNQDGNVYLGNYAGSFILDVRKGDIKIGVAEKKNCEINLDNGRLDIRKVREGKFFLKSVTANINEADFITVDAKDCELKIDNVNELNLTTSRGECRIGQVEVLRGSSSFTKYEISDVGEELVYELVFGSMNVRNINKLFTQVDINSSRARMGLTFMEGAAYDLVIRHNKSVKMDIPAGVILKKREAAERRTYISEGRVGEKNEYGSKVKINAVGGKFFIQ